MVFLADGSMRDISQHFPNERLIGSTKMENSPTFIPVVAAAIRDSRGHVLLQQRPVGKRHGGLWEFPGGKVEPSEALREALVREIDEELSLLLDASSMMPAGFAEEAAKGERAIVLFLYNCARWSGEPSAREGQEWGWFSLAEAAELPMPPMDRDLLEKL